MASTENNVPAGTVGAETAAPTIDLVTNGTNDSGVDVDSTSAGGGSKDSNLKVLNESKNNVESSTATTEGDHPKKHKSVYYRIPETDPIPEVLNKRWLRVQSWKRLQDAALSHHPRDVFNKIPNFIGSDKAAKLLFETPEFQNSQRIKVDNDYVMNAIKSHVLNSNKELYISKISRSELMTKMSNLTGNAAANNVDVDVDHKPEEQQDEPKTNDKDSSIRGKDITIDDKDGIVLDMLVIGSVVVSETGQRIGRGNGYVDLDFAILWHSGIITDKTVIVTIVHDEQIREELPSNLFEKFDIPIDMIVTPTEVIRIEKKLSRPKEIFWHLLSERRLNVMPILRKLKEREEQAGKIIVLKEDDTDIDTGRIKRRELRNNYRNRRPDNWRRRDPRKFKNKEPKSEKPKRRFYKSPAKPNNTDRPQQVTKQSIRHQIWKELEEKKIGADPKLYYNRVPNYLGADKAADLLGETDEFKTAQRIKVSSDKAQDPVKIRTLNDGKELYVSAARDSTALYTKITCEKDAELDVKQMAIRTENFKRFGEDIPIHDGQPTLDMFVIGSVIVSKTTGQRIGRGHGYVDLDYGILKKSGVITDATLVVTTVHDEQLCDTLPEELFKEYDVPVDMIVTPTQIIRINAENRQKRPETLYWNLLTERRCQFVPILKTLLEKDAAEGKEVNCIKEDVDPLKKRFFRSFGIDRKRNSRYTSKQSKDDSNTQQSQQSRRRVMRRNQKPKSSINEPTTDGEQSANEKRDKEKERKRKKNRIQSDYCIRVTRIPRTARAKNFKTELREHGCAPLYMIWKGSKQTCYLYFNNKPTEETVDPTTNAQEETIQLVTNAIQNLSINESETNASDQSNETAAEKQPQQQQQQNGFEKRQRIIRPMRVELLKLGSKKTTEDETQSVQAAAASTDPLDALEKRIETVDITAV